MSAEMMDRELLELAAKAVGHKVNVSMQEERDAIGAGDVGLWIDGVSTCWNPRRDSGQALELAATLGIDLTPYPLYSEDARHSVVAKQRRSTDMMRQANPTEVIELYRTAGDPAEAWRLAITRAAAEIGRAMK